MLHRRLAPWTRLLGLVLLSVWMLATLEGARAQGIESIMAPGKLSKAHAKYEEECAQCHVKFDRQAQDRRCLDCHKETRADVNAHQGYHGKMKPQSCRSCHTEHKGVDGKIYTLDKTQFDHRQTNYALAGKHVKVACEKCHVPNKRYRETTSRCVDCHKKDDVHKNGLGQVCADCHTDASWKETKFDHAKTEFELLGKHLDTKCSDCHKERTYQDTPQSCHACHKKDDDAKGHRGVFGEKCDSCHGAKAWKTVGFRHDVDTKYGLLGKHRPAKCAACHTTNPYKIRTPQQCVACHAKDDKHKDTLGRSCENCHSEKAWTETLRFDHAKSDFPLLGKHAQAQCKDCHADAMFKQAGKTCLDCHKKDDKHVGSLGTACADCHTEKDWKASRFEHDKTKFRLRNAHAAATVKCDNCHKDVKSFRNTTRACNDCHAKQDKHETQLGRQCEACHTDRNWKVERYDHARARFALTGKHILVQCKNCHASPRFRDARQECVACHLKEDKHKRTLGTQCETCHNARAWSLWDFNHDRQTKYPLDGEHARVPCADCHRLPAPGTKAIAPVATDCQSCHRDRDVHDGKFGVRCAQCHVSQGWKKVVSRFFPQPKAP